MYCVIDWLYCVNCHCLITSSLLIISFFGSQMFLCRENLHSCTRAPEQVPHPGKDRTPMMIKNMLKKHADLSRFCRGEGFLPPSTLGSRSTLPPAAVRGEAPSQVRQSSTKVTTKSLPHRRATFSRVVALDGFLKMLLWLFLLYIQRLHNSSGHVSITLPCTCIYLYTGSTQTADPLGRSQRKNKVSLFAYRQEFACCVQPKCGTNILSGQRERL